MAGAGRPSAHGARDGQSILAMAFRPGTRSNSRRLRDAQRRTSHPDLLDWLAVELQGSPDASRSRWDVKRFQRLLLTSATFLQSWLPDASVRERDAENVWLSRGPHYRLSAETIRDQALAVAGLLDRRSGGPGVFPYQPAGLWEELAYDPQQFTAQTYRQSHGSDLYRRSLYTFWKRAAPPPSLSAFDAPDREICTALRADEQHASPGARADERSRLSGSGSQSLRSCRGAIAGRRERR